MAEDLPYAEDLFPAKKGEKPYADELFPESVDQNRARRNLGASPVQDYIFSRDNVSAARVLNHFGQGFSDGWGNDGLTVTKEVGDYMRKSGWFGDYEDGQASISKAANEAIFRPLAMTAVGAVETLFKGFGAAFSGAQRAVAETGADLGQLQLGRDLAAIPEAFQGTPHPIGTPKLAGAPSVPVSEALLLRARAAKIIGAGEEGWRGTKAEQPFERTFTGYLDAEGAAALDRGETIRQKPPVSPGEVPEFPASSEGSFDIKAGERAMRADVNTVAAAPDVHTTARGIAPDLFYKYDDIQAKRDTYSAQISELNDMRATTAAQAEEITGLKTKLQERLAETETQAREMAPAVKEAYAEAKKTAPDEAPSKVDLGSEESVSSPAVVINGKTYTGRSHLEAMEKAASELGTTVENIHTKIDDSMPTKFDAWETSSGRVIDSKEAAVIAKSPHEKLDSADPEFKPARPIEEQRSAIAKDVAEKMIAAGRPATEAQAAAAIDAAYWESRAARFNGAKGTAEEMYRREGPEILGPGMKSDYAAARAKPKVANVSLSQFISHIGIKDNDPLIGDVKSLTGGGRKFIRKDGVSLDTLRERAVEAGYIEKDSTIRTLLDAMRDEDKGRKVFAAGDEPAAAFNRDSHLNAIEKALDHELEKVGVDPKTVTDKVRARTIELIDKEGISDPITAYEKAEGEAGMFQEGDIKRGHIRLREDGRNTITLLKDANASTFIHEKGHDYLSRLIRDAADEKAPIDLKTDADAVFKWLGVDKAEDIKTRHHEKFARGFENYVMEGRAPNQGLARVFEQFRQWLVRIYTEASRLKAPINDEIRGVFDRMLAVKPEDTVIAPDRAPEAMAGRHEAIAGETPAIAGADVAGTMRAERDNMAGRLPPDEQNARLAEIASGLEGRAPGGAESLRDGNAPEPAAGRGGPDTQSGAVGAGGSEVAPEASAVAPKPAGPSVKTPTPGSPHSAFDTSGDLTDKAGNIRLDLLNAPDDVKNIISQVADENGQFQNVRGPVTDIQVAELADAMGMDATYLSTRKLGEAWTAPQIVALRNLLIQSATEVRNLMKKAAQGNDADLLAYAEAKTRHMMIQERVSSVTAEAGRALRAFQRRFTAGLGEAQDLGAFLKDATGKTLFQLEREVQLGMSLETPSQVSKFIHDSRKATTPEMLQEIWINALLSGPMTHVKNLIGNTAVAVLSPAETAMAAGVGKVRALFGNDGERVHLGEAKANLFGLIQGAQDGIVAAKYAFLHEEQYTRAQTLEQGKFHAVPSKRIVLKNYEQGSPEYNARIESFANARARAERLTGERMASRVEELKSNPTPDMVAEAAQNAVEIGGKQVRLPGRFLTAEDELFKSIAYRQKLNELAFRQASKEGLAGDAFNGRVAQLTMSPPEEMMLAATKNADYQTFTNTLGKTGIALQQFSNSHILAKMVVPFIRTPLNLLKFANERTPLGVFSREVRANLNGTNGKIAQDTQIARMAIGTSLAATVMYLADQGTITGGGPSDKNEKATLMLSGWRPYSIKVGDSYYSYGWLDPFSTIMGISADMADAVKQASGDTGEEVSKIATNLFASISKNILSKSSLRGASDLLNAATDPDRWGAKYLQNLAGTVVPSFVAQQAKAHDEFQREARTVVDSIKARIPGLRQDLLPKRDIWGEPMKAGENLGPDTLSPVAMSKLTNDKATKALLDAEVFPAKLGRKIRGVDLTDQQYDDLARVGGRMAKMRVDALVSNPGFDHAPQEIRADLLRKTINASHDAARSMIMMQNPGIIKEALDNKMSAVGR